MQEHISHGTQTLQPFPTALSHKSQAKTDIDSREMVNVNLLVNHQWLTTVWEFQTGQQCFSINVIETFLFR